MTPKNPRVFLDISVIGPTIPKECVEVMRHKVPHSLPMLAQLRMARRVIVCKSYKEDFTLL
jgi:hypothetical protein